VTKHRRGVLDDAMLHRCPQMIREGVRRPRRGTGRAQRRTRDPNTDTANPALNGGACAARISVNLAHGSTAIVATVTTISLIGLYPDGVAERPWQRRLLRGTWGVLALPPLAMLANPSLVIDAYLLDPAPLVPSPLVVGWLVPFGATLQAVSFGAFYGVGLIGPALLLWRYRRATPEQRVLMRGLLYTVLLAVVTLVAYGVIHVVGIRPSWVADLLLGGLAIAVMLMIPVCIVVGVLRYRLFDIDLVVRRARPGAAGTDSSRVRGSADHRGGARVPAAPAAAGVAGRPVGVRGADRPVRAADLVRRDVGAHG